MIFKTIFIFTLLSFSVAEFLEDPASLDDPEIDDSVFAEEQKVKDETVLPEEEILLGVSNNRGNTIASCVRSKLGHAYVWGATGPNNFDCSGLAYFCHKRVGITIPRVSRDQSRGGKAVSNLLPGDLCFFDFGNGVSHVGTYVGNGQMVHAANEKKGVIQSAVTSGYWRGVFNNARRYW